MYYLGLVNEAYATPRAGLLPPLSSPDCKPCAKYESNAVSYVAKGYRYDQPALNLLEASPNALDDSHSAKRVIDVVIHQRPAHIIDSGNRVVDTVPEADAVVIMTMSRAESGWFVDLVQLTS